MRKRVGKLAGPWVSKSVAHGASYGRARVVREKCFRSHALGGRDKTARPSTHAMYAHMCAGKQRSIRKHVLTGQRGGFQKPRLYRHRWAGLKGKVGKEAGQKREL